MATAAAQRAGPSLEPSIILTSEGELLLEPTNYAPSIYLSTPYPPETTFPFALTPNLKGRPIAEKVAIIKTLSKQGVIADLLRVHGAIYFKDLELLGAEDFSQFATAFGWSPHEDIGNPVRRTVHAYNVATANEGPNTLPVHPHNEFGLSPHYPAYVFFYCASPPTTGGETPINNSIVLYYQLKQKHPEFIKEVEKKGVKYQLFYPNTAKDQNLSPRNSVLQAYGKHVQDTDSVEEIRLKIEDEIRRLPTASWVWENQSESNQLGDLRVWQVLPAVRVHQKTGLPAFFNNVVSQFIRAATAGTLEPPHLTKDGEFQPPCFYGDGSLIPVQYLQSAIDIIQSTRSLVSWKRGDILLLDNHAIQHAREPWTGPRKLLASLWDEA